MIKEILEFSISNLQQTIIILKEKIIILFRAVGLLIIMGSIFMALIFIISELLRDRVKKKNRSPVLHSFE